MKAKEIFDACYGRYRSLHDWMEDTTGKVRAIDLESPSSGYSWRPARGRACEYVADFERIGRDALRRPEWKGRLKLFEIYYLHTMEYKEAIKLVGVSDGNPCGARRDGSERHPICSVNVASVCSQHAPPTPIPEK